MKRGFFKTNGTASIRKPIPEGTTTASDQPPCNIIVESIDLCPNDGPHVYKARISPATRDSRPAFDTSFCTRIPRSTIDSYGPSESFIAAATIRRLLDEPKFPSSPPDIPTSKVYELRLSDSNLGRGMFALRTLKIGDLILVERPMLLVCNNSAVIGDLKWADLSGPPISAEDLLKSVGVFHAILEVLFSRMRKVDQDAYLALPNVHMDDPTLVGIWRTNNTLMNRLNVANESFTYSAMFREGTRINHSCEPNSNLSFDPVSLSVQVRATKPIGEGEEISMSACNPTLSTPLRSTWLTSLGMKCTCPSCVHDPSIARNDTIRVSIPDRMEQLENLVASAPLSSYELYEAMRSPGRKTAKLSQQLKNQHAHAHKVNDMVCKLIADMKAEGLDGCICYLKATETHCREIMELSSTSKFSGTSEQSSSSARARWDSEVKQLAKDTAALHKAHKGSFEKHEFEKILGPDGLGLVTFPN